MRAPVRLSRPCCKTRSGRPEGSRRHGRLRVRAPVRHRPHLLWTSAFPPHSSTTRTSHGPVRPRTVRPEALSWDRAPPWRKQQGRFDQRPQDTVLRVRPCRRRWLCKSHREEFARSSHPSVLPSTQCQRRLGARLPREGQHRETGPSTGRPTVVEKDGLEPPTGLQVRPSWRRRRRSNGRRGGWAPLSPHRPLHHQKSQADHQLCPARHRAESRQARHSVLAWTRPLLSSRS